jgi:hypothetical protein
LGGLVLLAVGGCFWAPPGRPAGLVEPFKPFTGPRGADAVLLDVAVVEQPVGDRYVNHGLWADADEQVCDLERKAALAENGFRVGLVGGNPPFAFLGLVTSERSCPDPRRVQMRAGNAKPLPLGDVRPQLRAQLHTGGKSTPVTLDQAQCLLQVTPTLLPDGAIKLAFLPTVQHGAKTLWTLSVEGGLPLQGQRPIERYPALGWEVTLAGAEYVVVGARFEKADTLGRAFFVSTEGAKPVQRLLVLRAARMAPPEEAPEGADAGRPATARPLALQAVSTVRGSRE